MAREFVWGDGERVMFVVDSVSEDVQGFTRLVPAMVSARYPEMRVSYLPRPVGGNRIGEVIQRLSRDILRDDALPTWIGISLGLNDVDFEQPGTPLGRFHALYGNLLEQLAMQTDRRAQLVCLTTTVMTEEQDSPLFHAADGYNDAIREVAFTHGAQVMDIQRVMMEAIVRGQSVTPDMRYTTDGRHLNTYGHYLMTLTMLQYLHFALPAVPYSGPGVEARAA